MALDGFPEIRSWFASITGVFTIFDSNRCSENGALAVHEPRQIVFAQIAVQRYNDALETSGHALGISCRPELSAKRAIKRKRAHTFMILSAASRGGHQPLKEQGRPGP